MLSDITLTPAQVVSVGSWAECGEAMASLELRVIGDRLLVEQGDDFVCVGAAGEIDEEAGWPIG